MNRTDDWSWFDAPEMDEVDLASHSVTAILVCRNAGEWLNSTLAGIAQQDRRPDVIVAVDNGSDDDTRDLLDDALSSGMIDLIIEGDSSWSFGDAVTDALSFVEPTEWIWLLHDDAVPDYNALSELLILGARTARLAIAVPLLVRPTRRHHVARTLEVGSTISGSGRRELGLESNEVSQGQYESHSVLGGSTCGMLVNWETFIAISGFDRGIAGYRDGVDLGWRAQLNGEWVLTCPTARFIHRQVGRSEIRQGTIAQQAGRSEESWDRLMGLRLVAAHSRGLVRLWTWFRIVLVCLLRAFGFLLGKAPDRSKDELVALFDFIFRSHKTVSKLRKKIKKIAKGKSTRARIRSLRPTMGSTIESGAQAVARWFHDVFGAQNDSDMTLDDLLGDEYTRRIGEGRWKVPPLVWIGLIVAGIVLMARGMFHSGIVTASGLLGAPATIADAFQLALGQDGSTQSLSQPWLTLSAVGSALAVRPTWFVLAVLILCFPVCMLVAWWFARYRIESSQLRWLASAGYGLLPIIMGGLNRGAIWLALLAMVLPFLVEWVLRSDMRWSGARSLQTMAGIALSGVIVIPIMPVLWVIVIIAVVCVSIVARNSGGIIRAIIAALIPVGLWGQWIPTLIKNPGRIITGPEALLSPAPEGWEMLIGRPVDQGLPPLWVSIVVFGCLWLWALVAMAMDTTSRYIVVGAIAAIGAGMWLSHLSIAFGSSYAVPDPTVWLLLGFSAILLTGVQRIDQMAGRLQASDFGLRQASLVFLSFVLAACLAIGAVWAAIAGMTGVVRGADPTIPAYLAQTEVERNAATLFIDGGQGTWNLRTGGQSMWGQGEVPSGAMAAPEARSRTIEFVAEAIAGQSDESAAGHLATLGVAAVVVLNPSPQTITALDTVPGIQRTTNDGSVQIWNVEGDPNPPTRVALAADGFPTQYLTPKDKVAPDSPEVLLLSQTPDPTLHVYVGGEEVFPMDSPDWRAAFSLGGASGQVTWERDVPAMWVVWVQLGVVILLIIFIFPPLNAGRPIPGEAKRGLRGVES